MLKQEVLYLFVIKKKTQHFIYNSIVKSFRVSMNTIDVNNKCIVDTLLWAEVTSNSMMFRQKIYKWSNHGTWSCLKCCRGPCFLSSCFVLFLWTLDIVTLLVITTFNIMNFIHLVLIAMITSIRYVSIA